MEENCINEKITPELYGKFRDKYKSELQQLVAEINKTNSRVRTSKFINKRFSQIKNGINNFPQVIFPGSIQI